MIGLNTDIVNHKDILLTILVYFLRMKKKYKVRIMK